jgi:HlyD family type I secretion membrane fusion protein
MTDLACKLEGLKRTALATVTLLAALFATWSAVAPLSSATMATGIVSPDTGRKTVQHLEGGIVEKILVNEGDKVAAGQTLVVLVDARAHANYETQLRRRAELRVQNLRLRALLEGSPRPDFSGLADDVLRDPSLPAYLENELGLFQSKRASLVAKIGAIHDEIDSLQHGVAALTDEIGFAREELNLTFEDLETKRELLAKGLTTKPAVLALDRHRTEIQAKIADLDAKRIAQRSTIEQKKKAQLGEASSFRNEIADGLAKAAAELAAVDQQVAAASDAMWREDVRAPEAGTVVSLKVRTPGAALPPGGAVADLVPANDKLVLEVRVKPDDISRVHSGMDAQVMFTAYSPREVPLLPAVVTTVSADAVTDPATREVYYKAELHMNDAELDNLAPGVSLVAGMQVEAFIENHKRTLVKWLIEPIERSFRRAGREY